MVKSPLGKFSFFHRKNYLINPKFQLTLIGYTAITLAIVIGVLWGANHYFFGVFLKMGKNANLPDTHIYYQFLKGQHVLMNRIFFSVTGIVTLILGVFGVLVSHKIAGPIYRICSHMKNSIHQNTLSDVSFRKGDFFPELAEAYNAQLVAIREKGSKK